MTTDTELLRQAAALHARGDLGGARRAAESLVQRNPNDGMALHFLGVVCCQSGMIEEGAGYLRRALKANPASVDLRLNLAQALLQLGRLDEADQLLVAPEAGSAPEVGRLRAEIAKAKGDSGSAVQLYEQLLQKHPNDAQLWNNLGNARGADGDLDGAIAAFQQAFRLQPNTALIHLNFGQTLVAAGRTEDAATVLGNAVRLSSGDPKVSVEAGKALQQLGRSSEALTAFSQAARVNRTDPDIFMWIGLVFSSMPDVKQAEQAYRMAIRVGPKFAPAYLNLAILLEQANRVDELRELLAQAEAQGLAGEEIEYIKALVARREGRFDEALQTAASVHSEALDPAIRAQFVGQLADRLGDADMAFSAFADMNAIIAAQPAAAQFDGTEHRHFVEGLDWQTTPEWIGSWTDAEPRPAPPAPAFLVGFLRSGTTLLDTILMGHPGTHVMEEAPILAAIEREGGTLAEIGGLDGAALDRLRARYFEEAAKFAPIPPDRLIIDKNPLASLRAPLIHRIFPDTRFIFALRHPCDVVLSCYMQLFAPTQATAPFLHLRTAAEYYAAVMTYWEKCRSLLPLQVHTVRYEDLVDNVEAEVRPLLEFLGLEWDEKVLDHQKTAVERGYIRTPSYAQVTEGIYSRSSGRWERYRAYLSDIFPILRPWAEKFGYSLD